ncbi:MAG: histone H1 [Bacteroidetes bacterium]|nr:histone H1 [Bacteroidota bacterium]
MAKIPRPKDINEKARQIVALATGEITDKNPDEGKNPAAVELGRLGGLKGGKARAARLSPERRKEIAQMAARKRWGKE